MTRTRNQFGAPLPDRPKYRSRPTQNPYLLDKASGEIVIAAIRRASERFKWILLAAHVRTTHVHVVITADCEPEKVLTTLKAYSTRSLGAARPWARHGSTRYLWTAGDVNSAVDYVLHRQGEPLALYQPA